MYLIACSHERKRKTGEGGETWLYKHLLEQHRPENLQICPKMQNFD